MKKTMIIILISAIVLCGLGCNGSLTEKAKIEKLQAIIDEYNQKASDFELVLYEPDMDTYLEMTEEEFTDFIDLMYKRGLEQAHAEVELDDDGKAIISIRAENISEKP